MSVGVAQAQVGDVYLYPVPGYNAAVMQQIQTDSVNRARENFDRDTRQTSRSTSRLSYPSNRMRGAASENFFVPRDAMVSAQVKRELLDKISSASSVKTAQIIGRTFDRKDVRTAFDEIASPYGLHTDDYAEVYAGHLIMMWMVANLREAPSLDQVHAIVQQTRRALGREIADLPMQDRQRQAEGMMYDTVLAVYAKREAERDHDEAYLQEMAARAQRNMLKQGLDMQALVLSDAGLTRR